MPDPTNPAAPCGDPHDPLDTLAHYALAECARRGKGHAGGVNQAIDKLREVIDERCAPMPPPNQPAAPAVDPREVCARVVEKLYRTEASYGQLDSEGTARECRRRCAAAIRALPPFAAQQPDSETHMHRMLALVGRAIEGQDINKQFGGNAPEDIQCLLDNIDALHRRLHAAQQPSEAVRRYDALVDALIRRDENKYVGWGSAGGPIECRHGISDRFHCQRCDYELIQSAIEDRRSALASVESENKQGTNT